MKPKPTASIIYHFSDIEDTRIARHKKHRLSDISFTAICATIFGADNWVTDLAQLTQGQHAQWVGLNSIIAVTAKRELKKNRERNTLLY